MAGRPKPIHQLTAAQFEWMFPDEDACRAYLVARRWPKGVRCRRCGNPAVYDLPSRKWHWQCEKCAPDDYRFSHIAGNDRMLKQAAFVLILLILIMVGFVLAERAFVPSFQQCIAQQQKTEADTSSEKNPSRFSVIIDAHVRCSGAFIERHNGSLTALATIFIALFTFTLWQSSEKMWAITKSAAESAKRSADVAEHSLTIVERAFITISDISITTIAQHRTIIDHRIHINVINSGRTPAKNYASQTNLVVLDDIPDDFRFADRPHEELAKTVVGPQSRTYILVDFFYSGCHRNIPKKQEDLDLRLDRI